MSGAVAFIAPMLVSWSVDFVLCAAIERAAISRVSMWIAKSLVHAFLFTPFLFGTRETHGVAILPYIVVLTGLPTGASTAVKIAFPSTVFVASLGLYIAINPLVSRFADRKMSLVELADTHVSVEWLNRFATIKGKALPPEPGQAPVYILQASLLSYWDYPGEHVQITEAEKARIISFATRKLSRRFTVVLN